jgi:CheY-like chemotaxis protein
MGTPTVVWMTITTLGSRRSLATAVAVTALARSEDGQMILGAGFDAHVPKPVDASSLVEIVGSLARRRLKT